ncbi:DUF6941 family protein [Pseudomonas sp. NY15364]|jgi:hypothetical protein|uniref:DUF6941 family protein n=1 Tax=Pseudomonas sp. NY15364 TaxID=3400353 RepID=UPI003A8C86D1
MNERSAYAIYCEDAREEVHGKVSLMGIYADYAIFSKFPANVSKFVIVVFANTSRSNPFKTLKFRAKAGNHVLGEMDIDQNNIQEDLAASPVDLEDIQVKVQMVFTPISVNKPCKVYVEVITESETLTTRPLIFETSERKDIPIPVLREVEGKLPENLA